jgi:hypothetical protein
MMDSLRGISRSARSTSSTINTSNMPTILVEFYGEDDILGVDGYKPKRRYVCRTVEEAEMALGLIERHENIPPVEELEQVKNF